MHPFEVPRPANGVAPEKSSEPKASDCSKERSSLVLYMRIASKSCCALLRRRRMVDVEWYLSVERRRREEGSFNCQVGLFCGF